MQTMLDKEMPLQRKRRRRSVLALLFLVFGTGMLTSAGWWIALRMQIIRPIAPVEQVASAGMNRQTETQAPYQVQKPIESSGKNQALVDVQNQSLKYDKRENLNRIQGQNQNQAQNQIQDQNKGQEQNQFQNQRLGTAQTVEPGTLVSNEVNPLPVTQTETSMVVSDEVVPERLPLPLGPVVHTNHVGLNPPPERIDVAGIVEIIKPRRLRPVTFGPTIGLASEHFSTLNGATIGGSVNWHFAKYWGLRSSVLYNYLRPSPNTRPVTSLRAQEYADATGNYTLLDPYGHLIDPQTGMSTATNKVYVPLQRLNRFEAPLMVYGQIFKRLRLMAGPTVSYSLSVQADKVYALDRVVSNSASERSADKVDALAADEVKRWQLGFQSGIGLRLGDRLEMDFLYRINSIRTYSRVLYDYDGSLLEYAPQRSAQINNLTIFTLNGIMFF